MSRGVLIIPAFNEEARLGDVLERVHAAGVSEAVVVINDGSRDQTHRVAADHGAQVIDHEVNRGYARALTTGLQHAIERNYDHLVFMDADGQHDPRAIASLRARAEEADVPDIVIGSRFVEQTGYKAPAGRRLGMLVFSLLTRALGGHRIYDTTSGFKLIRRAAFAALAAQTFNDYHAEMLIYSMLAGYTVAEVPVHVSERGGGTSMYSWLDSIKYPVRTLAKIAQLIPEARKHHR
jgi:glycosyltransferase involved in cell wall biosynthesis